MAYTALYRNFRPIKFSEMVGQEHITKTLRNQIIAGRVGHAYLFNGGRGTGKTTSAKILARAVNCLNPKDGEPCNECEICKDILNGSLTDVVEMDAASNNSVDDIRIIRDEVNFLPTKAKFRVYIIDEVHMLSAGAFNALLKTLEEPPEHVKFILATTEPQKLPNTILSRCQRFDFKKIPEQDIIKRLKIICENAGINAEEDALKIIAVLSEGYMRDAISILERCSQENIEKIEASNVKDLVGIPSLEYINNLASGILEYDTVKALKAIDDVIDSGKDLYNFLWEIIKYFKDILVFKATNNLKLYSENEIAEIKKLADITEEQRLLNIIYLLSEIEGDLKWSSQKTIMFQTGIIKACRKNNISSEVIDSSIEKRIEILESKLSGMKNISSVQNASSTTQITSRQVPKNENNISNLNNKNINLDSNDVNYKWKKVIDNLKGKGKIRLYTALINSRINEVNDMVWEVEFPKGLTSFNKKLLEDSSNNKELLKEVCLVAGKEIHLKFKAENNDVKFESTPTQTSTISDLGIDINIIE